MKLFSNYFGLVLEFLGRFGFFFVNHRTNRYQTTKLHSDIVQLTLHMTKSNFRVVDGKKVFKRSGESQANCIFYSEKTVILKKSQGKLNYFGLL